jgi:hypothetical protein
MKAKFVEGKLQLYAPVANCSSLVEETLGQLAFFAKYRKKRIDIFRLRLPPLRDL